MSTKASERAALLSDVCVASTGESFVEWRDRVVSEAPAPTDLQVMQLLGLFKQAADKPVTIVGDGPMRREENVRVAA